MQFARGGDEECYWTFTYNSLHTPTRWRARILNCGLMDNAAFTDEAAEKHGKSAVLVRLNLVCFVNVKDGVSEGALVVNQGQRAAGRQVIHTLRAISPSVCIVVNDLPRYLRPLSKDLVGVP